jgi:flavin-dependent dehydrogenase
MAFARLDADVCVVGGGPAGAALACRLATLGRHVVVVERHPFPRPHVGESVSPGVWPLLDMLGARTAVEAAGFQRAIEALVHWGSPEPHPLMNAEPGLTVDRGVFDQLLLDRARAAGATVLQPATARPASAVDGGWILPVLTADGARTIRARFIADASGRRRVLGGRRRRTSARTLALHASWRGLSESGAQTVVEARPEYWLWGAHLPDGAFRAMAFVEPELVRRRLLRTGQDLGQLYRELLAGAPLFRHVVAGEARLEGAVSACDATCYADEDPIDATSVKVGEAGFAIDPLSSSGVQTAIQTGVAASAAVHSILCEDGEVDAAVAYYREHQRHAVERHARLAARSYGDCASYAAEPFWRRRAAEAPEPPAARAPIALRNLLPLRVRLPCGSTLAPTPCVVGDRVEWRRALSHPTLSRPVAFLGDSELAPLLDKLDADRLLGEVVEDWARSVTPALAYSIAGWLASRGLLDPI